MKKQFVLMCVVLLFSCGFLNAQQLNNPDSAVLERNQMSKKIIQLRDTIAVKIISVSTASPTLPATSKPVYEKATRDLKFYQAQLEKGLDEIINTKVWQADIKSRSSRLLTDMREKYKITERELEKIGHP